ncbi:MaoC/PaaZ C-terminal domain-containing protein [Microvirga vignae]|uniref:MaoC/PaaZ C-terminal domain-containing protein n=1 Tax=Microvirga vignae TaxID=1225564 RepID=UPI0006998182|nr:MaoC/PaaZ C-terminal domain-containing protein [Microvirga vignae]
MTKWIIEEFDQIQEGEEKTIEVPVTEARITQFAEIVSDGNPLHLDEGFAKTTRFGRFNAHGAWMTSLIIGVVGSEAPGPGWFCLGVQTDFTAPAYLGDQRESKGSR